MRSGCLFMAMPVIAIPLVFAAYGHLIWTGMGGIAADGDLVTMHFEACEDAVQPIRDRVLMMGLPDAEFHFADGTLELKARLPSEHGVASSIPATLSTPGRFGIVARGSHTPIVNHDDIVDAGVRMDISATPQTYIKLTQEAGRELNLAMRSQPAGGLIFLLDGMPVYEHENMYELGSDVDIPAQGADNREGMRSAASMGVVLRHGPLPCSVRHLTTEVIEEARSK
jgi:hypothetical protein